MAAGRLFLFGGLWWMLHPGDARSWIVGVPAVLLAAWFSLRLAPSGARGIRLHRLPGYLAYFVAGSLWGGIDVAARALRPRPSLRPETSRLPLRIPAGTPRIFLVNATSLQPGTLSADLQGNVLVIHSIGDSGKALDRIREMERRVAALFGVDLPGGE